MKLAKKSSSLTTRKTNGVRIEEPIIVVMVEVKINKVSRSRITKGIVAITVVVLLIVSSTSLFSSLTYHNYAYAQGASTAQKKVLRIGYFPNVNHAQAVIGFGTNDFKK